MKCYWTPYRGIDTILHCLYCNFIVHYWTPYRGIETMTPHTYLSSSNYWTPYRGIEMLICFPWKGSGGGVVYGCGVWRVKSWVKNVLNTNKYIAIFLIKWGWSRLTYLPLVVIIFEKSIILFYWTPYRGIETDSFIRNFIVRAKYYWTPYRGIETVHGREFLICVHLLNPL